jgi:hypothetical protein
MKKFVSWLGAWLMPAVLATQAIEIGRIMSQESPEKKLARPHLNKKTGWW